MNEPVVITGMGALTCLGPDLESFWGGLVAGRTGIGPIRKFDAAGLRNPEAGEVKEMNTGLLPDWSQGMDDAVRFALAATREAVLGAGLWCDTPDPEMGVILATNFGGAATFQRWALDSDPQDFRNSLPSTATDAVALIVRATGPRATLSLSCSSGAGAIGLASDWLRLGRAHRMIAGGYDALTLYSLAGLSCLRTVTTGRLQPFDKNRSGTVFGEGAGIVVLETLATARDRGVKPLAVVRGWASNNNAYHLTAPESKGEGQLAVMRRAFAAAGVEPASIGYINAHGTGTRYNDPAETAAIHALMGDAAFAVPVSSIKAAISHTMGAAGALEAIACVEAIRTSQVPPTLNWEERDPDCDLDYVPNEARSQHIDRALSLSSGIGGNNAALILERYEE